MLSDFRKLLSLFEYSDQKTIETNTLLLPCPNKERHVNSSDNTPSYSIKKEENFAYCFTCREKSTTPLNFLIKNRDKFIFKKQLVNKFQQNYFNYSSDLLGISKDVFDEIKDSIFDKEKKVEEILEEIKEVENGSYYFRNINNIYLNNMNVLNKEEKSKIQKYKLELDKKNVIIKKEIILEMNEFINKINTIIKNEKQNKDKLERDLKSKINKSIYKYSNEEFNASKVLIDKSISVKILEKYNINTMTQKKIVEIKTKLLNEYSEDTLVNLKYLNKNKNLFFKNHRIIIPYFHRNKTLKGLQFRTTVVDQKNYKFLLSGKSDYFFSDSFEASKKVIITEGVSDFLTLETLFEKEKGFNDVSVFCIQSVSRKLDRKVLLELFEKEVFLLLDNDPAGERGTIDFIKNINIMNKDLSLNLLTPMLDVYNDVNEYYNKNEMEFVVSLKNRLYKSMENKLKIEQISSLEKNDKTMVLDKDSMYSMSFLKDKQCYYNISGNNVIKLSRSSINNLLNKNELGIYFNNKELKSQEMRPEYESKINKLIPLIVDVLTPQKKYYMKRYDKLTKKEKGVFLSNYFRLKYFVNKKGLKPEQEEIVKKHIDIFNKNNILIVNKEDTVIEEGGVNQLKEELDVIISKNNKYSYSVDYIDYILKIKEIVEYCKEKNIRSNIRGSANSSYILYILGLTKINPLKHELLLFQRFLNKEKDTFVDIDLEVPGNKRQEIIDIFELSTPLIIDKNKLSKKHSSKLFIFKNMKGQIPFESKELEKQYLSFDILGSNLLNLNKSIEDLTEDNVGDYSKIMENVDGLPHLNTPKSKKVMEYLNLKEIKKEEICDLLALNRPMFKINSFLLTKEYKKRKTQEYKSRFSFLRKTYGIILYQEQLMLLLKHLGFGLGIVNKIIQHKSHMNKVSDKDKVLLLTIYKNIKEEIIKKEDKKEKDELNNLWDLQIKHLIDGVYFFNYAHAINYENLILNQYREKY